MTPEPDLIAPSDLHSSPTRVKTKSIHFFLKVQTLTRLGRCLLAAQEAKTGGLPGSRPLTILK